MYYVYILKSLKNGDLYVGFCIDLRARFKLHNDGDVKSTKPSIPWKLIYYEAYVSKLDATKREANLKKNHRAKEDLKIQITVSLKI